MRKHEIADAAIICRALGHGWDEGTSIESALRGPGIKQSYRCVRCLSERHDAISRNGELEQRRYIYLAGYKIAKLYRPELRLLMRKLGQ